jgi:hypothetical protein
VRESHGAGTTTPVSWFEKRMKRKEEGTNKQRADDNTTTNNNNKETTTTKENERVSVIASVVFVKYI